MKQGPRFPNNPSLPGLQLFTAGSGHEAEGRRKERNQHGNKTRSPNTPRNGHGGHLHARLHKAPLALRCPAGYLASHRGLSPLQEAVEEGRGRAAALQALELHEGSSGCSAGLLGKQRMLRNAALLWQVPSLTPGADAPTRKHPLEV